MHAVILAAGRGERLRPITEHVPKPLIPFWDKPFITYLLDNLQGFADEATIVIGRDEEIRHRLGDSYGGIGLRYVAQDNPAGTGDAVMQTRGLLQEPFLVLLADTCPPRETIAQLIEAPADAMLTVIEVSDPENHLGVDIRDGLVVEDLWTDSRFVDAGAFRFSPTIYDALDGLPPKDKELRILQGVQQLLLTGAEVRAAQMQQPWLQFGDHEGLSGVLRVMRELRSEGADDDSYVGLSHEGCRIENSLVFGPGQLADCAIKDSFVYCAGRVEGEAVSGEMVAWT